MAIYPVCFSEGEFKNFKDARLQLNDLSALRGYAIFVFMRTYHGKPFLPDYYLSRFFNSANSLGIAPKISQDDLLHVVEQLLRQNNSSGEVGLRFVATGGPAEDSVTVSNPAFFILVEDLVDYPESNYTEGIKLMTIDYQRPLPEVKTTNYQVALLNMAEAKKRGASEILYRSKGKLLECTRNNFFIVKGETVVTADENILHGCTRRFVLELVQELQINLELREVGLEELQTATEAFITGTTRAITPVKQVDEIAFKAPGKVTQQLIKLFEQKVK